MAPKKSAHPKPTEPALYGDRRRVVFVTGAAKGIGQAIALRLARHGQLDLAINDLKLSDLDEVKKEVEKLGARCFPVAGDVTSEARVEEMVNEVVKELGYLDVMVSLSITGPLCPMHALGHPIPHSFTSCRLPMLVFPSFGLYLI